MLDCQLFGLSAGAHHLTNLLLHITNTLLLFGLLKRTTGALWRSAFVAAAFALHPLHVESVAWVAERKDVLSTLFWMLTIAVYLRYVKHPGKVKYLLTLLVFALGLMAKPMLVTLPFVLLLLDYWPLGRLQLGKGAKNANRRKQKSVNTRSQWKLSSSLVWEKVPFFVLSAISSIVTFLVQQHGGAVKRIEAIPVIARFANASISYLRYIGKMFWPSRLAVFYPHPGDRLQMWQAVAAALLLLGISIWIIRLARSHKYLPVGWLWFLGTLVPVIGLVQVGGQALADRYTYVPLTGLFIIIAWGLSDLLTRWRYRKIVLGASAIIVLLALSICTGLQLRHWRNSITLFEHATEVTNDNHVAHNNLGVALQSKGRLDEALGHYRQALRLNPGDVEVHNNLGFALQAQGRLDEAIHHFHQALQVEPDFAEALYNLGNVLQSQGKLNEAISRYRRALQARPSYAEAHGNLGFALQSLGKLDEAINHYRRALQFNPDPATAHYNLATALQSQGKLDEAIHYYWQALQARPNFAEAYNNLGLALQSQGRLDEAVVHYRQALWVKPDFAEARYNLANVLRAQGKLDEAIVHYSLALQARPDFVEARYNLANVLQAQGKLDEAIDHYSHILKIKPDSALTHSDLGDVLSAQGKLDEAISHYRHALRLKPDWPLPLSGLAWILATHPDQNLRDAGQAIELAERAAKLTQYQDAPILATLAAAYASAGQFDRAVTTAQKAMELASAARDDELANHIRGQLELYRQAKP